MSNKEKALKAARVIKEEIGMSEHSIPRVAEIIDLCLTWKDEQFKEYLEKKKEEKGIDLEPSSSIIEEIIFELFNNE